MKETMIKSSSAADGSFAPAVQLVKLEIHKVFLRFPSFHLKQNLSPSALADLTLASFKKQTNQVKAEHKNVNNTVRQASEKD